MKKLLTILLCGMILTLTACGNKETSFVFTQSTSETPYKEPTHGGATYLEGETTSKHTSTTSSVGDDYEIEDYFGVVNILRYHGEGGKIHIPTMIDGKTVTQIDEHAFRGTAVTNVTIPGTIKVIETRAFTDCGQLKTLTIADGVQTIEGYAFADCSNLTLVTLPDSIRELGDGAFSNCPLIKLTYRERTYTAVDIEELYDDVLWGSFR